MKRKIKALLTGLGVLVTAVFYQFFLLTQAVDQGL